MKIIPRAVLLALRNSRSGHCRPCGGRRSRRRQPGQRPDRCMPNRGRSSEFLQPHPHGRVERRPRRIAKLSIHARPDRRRAAVVTLSKTGRAHEAKLSGGVGLSRLHDRFGQQLLQARSMHPMSKPAPSARRSAWGGTPPNQRSGSVPGECATGPEALTGQLEAREFQSASLSC